MSRAEYIYAQAAVLKGEGFILSNDEMGEFVFAPGSVTHISTYMRRED